MTRDEVYEAMRKADAAGDANSVRQLSGYLEQLDKDEMFQSQNLQPVPGGGQPGEGIYRQPEADDSALTGFVGGAIKPIDNAAKWLSEVPGFKQIDEFGQSLGMPRAQEAAASNEAMRANNSRTGFQMLGNIAGTLPLAALPGGAITQGAAGGALLSNSDTLGGVAADAGIGAAGGKAGELLMRGIGGVVAPRLNQQLRTLIDAGVDVTPGQMARAQGGRGGDFLARSEDRAISTPFVGDRIAGARNRSLETFGRATINRALEPIGLSLPENVAGRRAVAYAGDRLGKAYDAILPRLSATGDQQFMSDLAAIHAEAANMLPQRIDQFNNILGGLNRFWQNGATLDGAALKEIETRIGERVRRAAMSTDADQRELGDRLGDVLASVRDLAARQNPAEAEALSRINRGWKSLTQVERAASNSRSEITPAGYSQSVKQSSDTTRRRGYARGEALNQDLSDAASDILPSEIADSGSAGRWQQSNLIAMGLGAAQLPAYLAAQGATRVLSRDPSQASQQIADLIRLAAPRVGAPAAAVTAGTIHSLTN